MRYDSNQGKRNERIESSMLDDKFRKRVVQKTTLQEDMNGIDRWIDDVAVDYKKANYKPGVQARQFKRLQQLQTEIYIYYQTVENAEGDTLCVYSVTIVRAHDMYAIMKPQPRNSNGHEWYGCSWDELLSIAITEDEAFGQR